MVGLSLPGSDQVDAITQTTTGLKINEATTAAPQTIPGKFSSVALSPDGAQIALGGGDGSIQLVNAKNPTEERPVIQAGSQAVLALAYNADGSQIAVGQCISQNTENKDQPVCQKNQISIWDLNSRQPIGTPIYILGKAPTSLAFHPVDPGWRPVLARVFNCSKSIQASRFIYH